MAKRVPYPPCDSGCPPQGYKYEWPELKGVDGQQAKAVIEKDNPFVTVVVVPSGARPIADFCCNRVLVYLDENGKVVGNTMIG